MKCLLISTTILLSAHAIADVPRGHVLVTDSVLHFSSSQGQNGWRYQFDRGQGTPVSDMPYYFFSYGTNRWCATPSFGGASSSPNVSHCTLQADWGHPNSGEDCNTPSSGLLRPIRTWLPPAPMRIKVRLQIVPATLSSGMRLDLLVDGQTGWTRTWSYGNQPPADEWLELFVDHSLSLRIDPLGSCGSDGAYQSMQIYAADCDGNGIADAVDISGGAPDANANGVPDICEVDPCPGDITNGGTVDAADLSILLAAWGTNGQAEFDTDIDNSGLVDGGDLALVLGGWGPCPQ